MCVDFDFCSRMQSRVPFSECNSTMGKASGRLGAASDAAGHHVSNVEGWGRVKRRTSPCDTETGDRTTRLEHGMSARRCIIRQSNWISTIDWPGCHIQVSTLILLPLPLYLRGCINAMTVMN